MGRMIIGVVGYAGSGKDEFAKALIEDGWERRAFADSLKEMATAIGWNGKKDDTGRRLLQNLGMAVREVIHKDAWVQAIETELTRDGNYDLDYVIPDVRFDNEVEWVKDNNGIIVLIDRPGVGPVNAHVSETLPDRVAWDYKVTNDETIEALHARAREVASQYAYAQAAA